MAECIAVLIFFWLGLVLVKKIMSNISIIMGALSGDVPTNSTGGYTDIPPEDEFLRKNDEEDWLK